ncbi:MAG: hypothetical protein SFX73_07805 [Kofleriaceae bacterium]|nr:hypothetical protein [Kofleriaceae bacterium]
MSATAVRLNFFLVNSSDEPRTVKLKSACGSVVQLAGLPAGTQRACAQPEREKTFVVRARSRVAIGDTLVRAKGDARTPALPRGSTIFSANIQSDDPHDVCGGGVAHIVREHTTGRLRRAKPNEEPIPATLPTPVVTPAPPSPKPVPAPRKVPGKVCPTCAFGCLHGVPTRKLGPDGCPVCGCDEPGF